jgi:hypothetical protein
MRGVWLFGCLWAACAADETRVPRKEPVDPGMTSMVAPCELPRVRVDLYFQVDSDFDLHVLTPAGNEIYFANREADGGELEEDLCISSCGPGVHGEAVYFCSMLPEGTYQAWIENFDGRARGNFTLAIGGEVSAAMMGYLPNMPGFAADPLEFEVN